ncbi:MAG: hypothetical protein HY720_32370 [Planctomycetes bacterium]|nr:hypothetical protein [Planctomycetota bacterium]
MDPVVLGLLFLILMLSTALLTWLLAKEKYQRAAPWEPDWKAMETREQIRKIEEFQAALEEARNKKDAGLAREIATKYVDFLQGLELGTYSHERLIRELKRFLEISAMEGREQGK